MFPIDGDSPVLCPKCSDTVWQSNSHDGIIQIVLGKSAHIAKHFEQHQKLHGADQLPPDAVEDAYGAQGALAHFQVWLEGRTLAW